VSLSSAMWDYVPVFPTLIAVVNGVIAVWMAHFKPERQKLKVGLLLFAILAGLGAAAATVAGQYHAMQATKQAQAETAETLMALAKFIGEGDALLGPLRDQSIAVDEDKLNGWGERVEKYLSGSASLGPSFMSRFRDGSGLLHGTPVGVDEKHAGYWNGITERVTRLQQFSAEVSARAPH
jgi:hypothetical protein